MRDTSRVTTLVYSTILVILLYTQNPVDSFEVIGPFIYTYENTYIYMVFLTYINSADPGLTTVNYHKVQDRQAALETILKLFSVKTCLRFSVTCT